MPASKNELLSIGAVAERTGLAVSAIRYYADVGLVEATRDSAGHRKFPRHALRRLAFVQAAQQVGLTLDEIRDALSSLPPHKAPTVAQWRRMSRSWRPRLDDQIRALEALRDRLDACIGCGCLSLTDCRLRNPDDKAAAEGTGAQYLTASDPPAGP